MCDQTTKKTVEKLLNGNFKRQKKKKELLMRYPRHSYIEDI